jgi:hypothetical protein
MEALGMLVRLLGKEAEALSGEWSDPFSDVPDWGAPYVGYAYEHGLTNGVADTLFGPQEQSNADQYLTFVLRAVGYSDRNGQDFPWDEPDALARSAGILTDAVRTDEFLRADVVLVSYAALFAEQKGGGAALSWLLYQSGAFTEEAFENATGAGLTEGRTAALWNRSVSISASSGEEFMEKFLAALSGLPASITLNVASGTTASYVAYLNKNLDRAVSYMQSYEGTRYSDRIVLRPGYTQGAQALACRDFLDYPADETIRSLYERALEITDALITDGMSDYEKAKAVHDYLVGHTEYDLTFAGTSGDVEGVLLDGMGICSGYAHTYRLLMRLCDMDCIVVAGTGTDASGTEQSHAWNMVKVDGNWYHVDVTWDDPVFSGPGVRDYIGYDYFLVGDETLKADHAWDGADLPAAGSDWN